MKRKDAWLERGARHREGWAGKAEHRSDQTYKKSIKIGDRTKTGQPILVGHHSRKRHRRDIQRIRNATGRASDEAALAKITQESNGETAGQPSSLHSTHGRSEGPDPQT
jgi:hypothetical protein